MTIAATITITTSLCALMINAILMVGMLLGGGLGERVHRWFFAMLLFGAVGACFELAGPLLIGLPGRAASALFRAADFASYAFGSLVGIAFAFYLYAYLSLKAAVAKTPFVLIALFNAANILLLAIGQFSRPFFWLDEAGAFHARDAVWLAQILPFLSMVIVVAVTIQNIGALRPRERVSLLLYMAAPMLCYGVEYLFNAYPLWISYFGTAVAMLAIYVNIQVELEHELKAKNAELVEGRVAIMLSQIQDHFLYNTLTSIEKLCDIDPPRAKTAVNDFAHYLRGNLDSLSEQGSIPFIDELEHVEAYLSLEQLRFGDELRVEYHIEADDFTLPPLTVQPIVENAVKHGVMKKPAGGTVVLSAEQRGDAFVVTVRDDGVGFDPALTQVDGRSHLGIENVQKRLKALCGGTLLLESAPGRGTTAVITIPKTPAERG